MSNELSLSEGIAGLVVRSALASDDEKERFRQKLIEEIKRFQDRMLKAFPDAEFTVIVHQDIKDSHPRFYVDCNIPMNTGGWNRGAKGTRLGGRFYVYDEKREESVFHKIMWQMSPKGWGGR